MSKQKCPEEKAGSPAWMATYGDLVTLLMCFFVLLFAFSNIDAQKFQAVMQSFQGSSGILSGGKALSEAPFVFDAMPEDQTSSMQVIDEKKPDSEIQKEKELQMELKELKEQIEEFVHEENMEYDIDVVQDSSSVIIRLKDNAVFDSGSAKIKAGSMKVLDFIVEVISADNLKYSEVIVEGHTDNFPINTSEFPTNWELASSRATNVLRYFVEIKGLDPFRISSAGYGEFRPIATNATDAGRAMNRRVDIIIKSGINRDRDDKE